jgi:hypothetical protein
VIRGDPEAVFDLVTTARYWPQWHPATVGVSGQVQQPMQLGDVIRERARIGGVEAENDWRVTEWSRPRRLVMEMPGTRLGDLKITYSFELTDHGVEFRRELVFDVSAMPQEISLKIVQQMENDSRVATERIKALAEGILTPPH